MKSESALESYNSKRLLFCKFDFFSRIFGTKALKKSRLHFPIFNFNENLQNIFEIERKTWSNRAEIALNENFSEIKNSPTPK